MKWIKKDDDWFNLNSFCHIWIEKGVDGKFFAMGEFTHSGEEVVLSNSQESSVGMFFTMEEWFEGEYCRVAKKS